MLSCQRNLQNEEVPRESKLALELLSYVGLSWYDMVFSICPAGTHLGIHVSPSQLRLCLLCWGDYVASVESIGIVEVVRKCWYWLSRKFCHLCCCGMWKRGMNVQDGIILYYHVLPPQSFNKGCKRVGIAVPELASLHCRHYHSSTNCH